MSLKKKIQNLIKSFIRYIFKLFYGKIRIRKYYRDNEVITKIVKINKTTNTIFKIKNGRIYTDYVQHLAVIHKNNLINKACYQLKDSSVISARKNFVILNGTPRIKKKIHGKVLSLVNGASGNENYFHWLYDILPRLVIFEKLYKLNILDYLYLPELKNFQIETLRLFNFDNIKFINSKKYRHIVCDELFVTTHPWHKYGNILNNGKNIPKWIFEEIYKKLIRHKKKFKCNKKIFIDRRDSKYNHCQIINDKILKKFLIKKGFSIYKVGELDLFKQIFLFNNAKIIIGAHGAAFANLIFCKKGTKVIEIFPKNHPNLVFKKISKFKNLNYTSIRSKTINEKNNLDGDIFIELKDLITKINF